MRHIDWLDMFTMTSFLGVGILAWRVRPRNRMGPLMVFAGLIYLLELLVRGFDPDPPVVLGLILKSLWLGVILHLSLAYPTGRLRSVWRRALMLLNYASFVVGAVVDTYVGAGWSRGETTSPLLSRFYDDVGTGIEFGLAGAVFVTQVAAWCRATSTQRRLLAPALGALMLVSVLLVTLKAGYSADWVEVLVSWSLPLIPIAYLAGLFRRRLDRAGVAGLVVRLGETPRVTQLAAELAAALHDPGVRLAFWSNVRGQYVDAGGDPIGPHGAGRAVTRIDRGGQPVALLEHDVALVEEPALVKATCAAAALALENERLQADLHARLRELAASRTRLAHAADAGRRRIERDLHDGVQQRLLAATMLLGRAENAPDGALVAEARATVLASLVELRALCQGIHPPVLTERGLPGALRELADTAPIQVDLDLDLDVDVGLMNLPLAPGVETAAYYVVAEALTNVVKHAGVERAAVTVSRLGHCLTVRVRDDGRGGADAATGTGLAGLAERVEVIGGWFEITSRAGAGTTITAELPYAA